MPRGSRAVGKVNIDQARAFILWESFELLVPELIAMRDVYIRAREELRKRSEGGNCNGCIDKQFAAWEAGWLKKMNEYIAMHPHLDVVTDQFIEAYSNTPEVNA